MVKPSGKYHVVRWQISPHARQILAQLSIGLCESALPEPQQSQLVLRHNGVAVVRPQRGRFDLQQLFTQRLGLVVSRSGLVRIGQVAHCR